MSYAKAAQTARASREYKEKLERDNKEMLSLLRILYEKEKDENMRHKIETILNRE